MVRQSDRLTMMRTRGKVNIMELEMWGVGPTEMKAIAAAEADDLIEGLLPSAGVVTFAGAPGIGKSFVALSWAAAIASGTPWIDRKVSGAYNVAYILGEGWRKFGRRVNAWEDVHGQLIPEGLRFIDGAGMGIDLADDDQVTEIIGRLQQMQAGLVVVDTFAMLANIDSENDNAQVGRVMRSAARIMQQTGATVVIVHHVSKGQGLVRGAAAFRGNADSVILAQRSKTAGDSSFSLSTREEDDGKQRDGEPVKITGLRVMSPGVLSHSQGKQAASDAQDEQAAQLQAAASRRRRSDAA